MTFGACCALAACARDEAYLVLDVTYPEAASGMFGRIKVKRNSGPWLADEPFSLEDLERRRRLAIHAEGDEIDATLEVQLQTCDQLAATSCLTIWTLEVAHAFERDKTTHLCVTLADEPQDRVQFDRRSDSPPEGVELVCEP
jgi:hypothetical protein